jgi:hypothetical protein
MSEPSYDELKSELEKMKAQKARTGDLSFKVSEKGAVSVYGLGRFPVTLYQEQWARLLGVAEDLRTFIKENSAKLKVKE